MDKDEFQARIVSGDEFEEWDDGIEVIFHEGACSATTEWNGKFIMEVNYGVLQDLFHYCIEREIPSSTPLPPRPMAGATTTSSKIPGSSSPSTSTATPSSCSISTCVAGCRRSTPRWWVSKYFNVYGPREQHKGLHGVRGLPPQYPGEAG